MPGLSRRCFSLTVLRSLPFTGPGKQKMWTGKAQACERASLTDFPPAVLRYLGSDAGFLVFVLATLQSSHAFDWAEPQSTQLRLPDPDPASSLTVSPPPKLFSPALGAANGNDGELQEASGLLVGPLSAVSSQLVAALILVASARQGSHRSTFSCPGCPACFWLLLAAMQVCSLRNQA